MSDQNKSPPESELTAVLKMMKDIALMLALSFGISAPAIILGMRNIDQEEKPEPRIEQLDDKPCPQRPLQTSLKPPGRASLERTSLA